jgi:two-component system NtrC family sensor kinase
MDHRWNRANSVPVPRQLESQPFLAAIARASSDAVIGKTLDGIVVFWNEAAEQLYGYRANEMLGREISILFPANRPTELAQLLAYAQAGRTVRDFHTERLRRDGSIVAVSITVAPVVDTDGVVLGVSTIAHDLTLYNRQIADLREAHRRADETLSTLDTLHRSAPVGLGFVDREFRIIHLNEVLAAVNGSTVEAQIGRLVAESVPAIWPQIEPVLRRVVENDESVLNIEVTGEIAGDPGHEHHWLASYYPVHLDQEVIGAGVVAIDITERREADEFRSIVMDNMAEGLYTVDSEGRLTSMNSAATTMLGWTEQELLGQEMRGVILAHGTGDDSIDEGNRELLTVRGEGRPVHLDDHVYVCKNGSLLPVDVSAAPSSLGARCRVRSSSSATSRTRGPNAFEYHAS